MLNEQNELALVLDGNVGMDRIPDLMRTMLTEMAREFPGHVLTVLAYAPSSPPRKIGTAHLDDRTREMSYVPRKIMAFLCPQNTTQKQKLLCKKQFMTS